MKKERKTRERKEKKRERREKKRDEREKSVNIGGVLGLK